jgi:ATP-dependent Clp protease ATP-binding subunit ClpA
VHNKPTTVKHALRAFFFACFFCLIHLYRGDFAKAGELLHSSIPKLERELEQLEVQSDTTSAHQSKMLADSVTAEAVASIVARHTGIPLSRLTGSESKKLLHMEDRLRERVVGQDHALISVSNCVRYVFRNKTLSFIPLHHFYQYRYHNHNIHRNSMLKS